MKFSKEHITRIVCILIWLVFPQIMQAQVGIKLGTTSSNFYYTETTMNPDLSYEVDLRPYFGYDIEWVQLGNQKPIFSPFVGVNYNFQITERFGLRPELSFTQKGVNFNQSEYERIIYKVKISYLEIPLSIGYKFIQRENFISELYLGGYGAFKIDAVKKVASHNSTVTTTKLDCVENFDGGIHLGMNFKHKAFDKYFLFDIRFFLGFSDILFMPDNQPKLYHSTKETKTTGLNLTVGYEF